MLCTKIVSDIQNNFCTQHVLQKYELLTKIYLYVLRFLMVKLTINDMTINQSKKQKEKQTTNSIKYTT